MRSMTFQIDDRSTGTVIPAVTVTVTENADGTLTFTLTQTGPVIGDLRGIFFDVADESLIPSLTVSADSGGLTEVRTGDDSVVDLGGGANLQGLVGSDGGYDVGLEIGTSGIGADDHRTFSFTLSAASALTLEDFANVDFGVRLTSVGEDGGERSASAKLLETVTGALDAIDDQASVQEDGPVSASGNVLGNDSGAGTGGTVIAVNGAASNVGADIAGSYGVLRLLADGSYLYVLDNAAVQTLAEGETLVEQFSYAARSYGDATSYSEDTAQLVVTIVGTNDGPVAQAITQSANEDGPSVTLNAVYADVDASDTHSFSVDSNATLGAVTSNGDGTFSYSASGAFEYLNAGQTAIDTFAYTVSDNHGASSTQTATVTVTGQNDAPVTTGGTTTGAVFEDGSRRAEGQLSATDVDQGAVLTWSVTNPGVLATPDYRFLMDNFRIVRNGVQYYNDDFGDNNPPPSAPGLLTEAFPTTTSYFLPAGLSFQESG
ncbi:MAG TPA: VCBS domain-containing protein, partial [Burkholderiales bacterium]|nr:VCBS domain-containing protein [Burkholderiales bacterium]